MRTAHDLTPDRHALLVTLALASLLHAACEGELALSTSASQDGPAPPMIVVPTDAGLLRSDASFPGPDAYVPPTCVPFCTNRQCGADGCGGVCGVCSAGTSCNASAQCEALPPVDNGPGTVPGDPPGVTHTVTLYGTTWCGYCQQAKRFFRDNDIEFTDRDLDEPGVSEEAYQRVYELTGRYSVSTPTVIVDDHVMLGWSEAECRGYLGL